MKAAKNVPATKSQTFILTIKKLQRFGKSLFTHSSLADGKDQRTCHSCVLEAPKSTPKWWIEKLVEALWKLQLFCSNLWILYNALVVTMFTAWTYLLNLTGNHKKSHRKREDATQPPCSKHFRGNYKRMAEPFPAKPTFRFGPKGPSKRRDKKEPMAGLK